MIDREKLAIDRDKLMTGLIIANIFYIIISVAILLIANLVLTMFAADWTANVLNLIWTVWLIIGAMLGITDIGALLRFVGLRLRAWLDEST